MGRCQGVCLLVSSCAAILMTSAPARAADIYVVAGANLQAAINNAQPGDRLLLEPGATFTGNFRLPNKGNVHELHHDPIGRRRHASSARGRPHRADRRGKPSGDQVAEHVTGDDGRRGSAPLATAVPRVPSERSRLWRHHRARCRRYDPDVALAGTARSRARPPVHPRRSGDRAEARRFASQRRDVGAELLHLRYQGHRHGYAGHHGIQRPGPVHHRQQLSGGRR